MTDPKEMCDYEMYGKESGCLHRCVDIDIFCKFNVLMDLEKEKGPFKRKIVQTKAVTKPRFTLLRPLATTHDITRQPPTARPQ